DETRVRLRRHALRDEVVDDPGAQPADVDDAFLTLNAVVLGRAVVAALDGHHRGDRGEPVQRAPRARVTTVHDEVDARERVQDRLRDVTPVGRPAVVVRDDTDAPHV